MQNTITVAQVNLLLSYHPLNIINIENSNFYNVLCKLESVSDILIKFHTNVKHYKTMCRTQEP